jgi:FkbM family methyltransferase
MISLKTKILNSLRKIFTFYPLERVLLFFLRGTKYLGFKSKIIPNPLLYKANSLRNVSRNGINYSLDLSCLMQWYVYWDFKAKDRDRLYSLVKKGDVVFDVGTNIGETLLNFARLTGDRGYVYGFEPDDENYNNVQKNISLNNFKNVQVFKQAISDKKETVKLYCVDPHNRGMNRILEAGQGTESQFILLETTTLDRIIAENKTERLNVMKIDIEGYEMHALKGAVETLKRFKPILFIEIGYTRLINNKTTPNELIKLLEELGYSIFHSETDQSITSQYNFSYLGDGGMDVYALASKENNKK